MTVTISCNDAAPHGILSDGGRPSEDNRRIKVAIADDHVIVREGIIKLLNSYPRICYLWEACDAVSTREQMERECPDILIADLCMPGTEGGGFLTKLREDFPSIRIIVLTMHITPLAIQKAFDSGVSAFVTKNDAFDTLVSMILRVSQGEQLIVSPTLRKTVEMISSSKPLHLAGRELEVLQEVVQGRSTKEIGAKLFISPKTVDVYRARLMKKFNVTKGTELISQAFASGIIPVIPSTLNASSSSGSKSEEDTR